MKAYIYILPCLIIAFTFSFYPFFRSLINSFLKINQTGKVLGWAGFSNYKILFSDKSFYNSIERTLLFTLLFVPLNTLVVLIAATLVRKNFKGVKIAEFFFFTPLAFSLTSATLIFKEIFRGRVSIVNRIFNLNIDWLSSRFPAMVVLVLLGVFLDFGLDFIILFSSFRSIDKSYIEAAELDGASSFRIYREIELPIIKPTLLTVIALSIKDALLIVAPIIILTEGGPFRSTETIMFYYYIEAFKSGNMAVGNTLSVLMVLLAIILTSAFVFRRKE